MTTERAEATLAKKTKAEAPKLTGQATRHLRALGHSLAPVLMIGKGGITDALVKEAERALLRHELIKVRVQGEAPVGRKDAGSELAAATHAALAQVLGRTFLLYKPHPQKPKIVLAKAKKIPRAQGDGEMGDKGGAKKRAREPVE